MRLQGRAVSAHRSSYAFTHITLPHSHTHTLADTPGSTGTHSKPHKHTALVRIPHTFISLPKALLQHANTHVGPACSNIRFSAARLVSKIDIVGSGGAEGGTEGERKGETGEREGGRGRSQFTQSYFG
jgi:hypothetical protein